MYVSHQHSVFSYLVRDVRQGDYVPVQLVDCPFSVHCKSSVLIRMNLEYISLCSAGTITLTLVTRGCATEIYKIAKTLILEVSFVVEDVHVFICYTDIAYVCNTSI